MNLARRLQSEKAEMNQVTQAVYLSQLDIR